MGVFTSGVGRATPVLLEALARVPGGTPAVVAITRSNRQVASLLDKSVDAVLTTGPFADERIEVTPLSRTCGSWSSERVTSSPTRRA